MHRMVNMPRLRGIKALSALITVYTIAYRIKMIVSICEGGGILTLSKVYLQLCAQCLAKVFGPLELCDLLPHFRLQT